MAVDIAVVVDRLGSTSYRNVVYITEPESLGRPFVCFRPHLGGAFRGDLSQLELLFMDALEAAPIDGVTYGYPYMTVDPECITSEGLEQLVDLVALHQEALKSTAALAGVGNAR